MRQGPTTRSNSFAAKITRQRPVSGVLSHKQPIAPRRLRKLRIKELRDAAERILYRAEVLRAEARRLVKMAEREEAKLARKPRSAAAPTAKALRRRG